MTKSVKAVVEKYLVWNVEVHLVPLARSVDSLADRQFAKYRKKEKKIPPPPIQVDSKKAVRSSMVRSNFETARARSHIIPVSHAKIKSTNGSFGIRKNSVRQL